MPHQRSTNSKHCCGHSLPSIWAYSNSRCQGCNRNGEDWRTSIFFGGCLCSKISPQEQKSSSGTPVEGSVSWPLHLVFLSLGHYCKIVPGHADPDVCGDRVSSCCAPVLLESGTRCPLGPVYGGCHVCSLDCGLTVRPRENPHLCEGDSWFYEGNNSSSNNNNPTLTLPSPYLHSFLAQHTQN